MTDNVKQPEEIGVEHIHANFQNLVALLTTALPTCRHLSVALTYLETAEMWAAKAAYLQEMSAKRAQADAIRPED